MQHLDECRFSVGSLRSILLADPASRQPNAMPFHLGHEVQYFTHVFNPYQVLGLEQAGTYEPWINLETPAACTPRLILS